MSKKILIVVCLLFCIFGIINYKFVLYNFYNLFGNYQYTLQNYSGALDTYNRAQSIMITPQSKYNQGVVNYKLGKYAQSIQDFTAAIQKDNSDLFSQKVYHNLGNSYYFTGKESSDVKDTISMYEKSIDSYNQGLSFINDPQTQHNKGIVEKELQKLKETLKQEEEIPSNSSEEKNGSEKGESSQQQDSSGQTKPATKNQSSGTGGSDSTGGSPKNTLGELTQEEEKYLQEYSQFLERLQKENQDGFNQKQSGNESFLDIFGANPFFQDPFGDNLKDW